MRATQRGCPTMTMDAPIPTPLKTRRTPGVAGEVFTTTTTAMDGHKKSGGGRRRRRKGSRSSRVKARTLLAVVALVLIGMLAMMVHINLSIFRQHKTERDGRQHIKDVFSKAGIKLSEAQLNEFPTWGEIREEVGDAPIIVGLETCEVFRNSIPPVNRSIGSLGMFNSGTNLVTKLVKQNCIIPERVDYYGNQTLTSTTWAHWRLTGCDGRCRGANTLRVFTERYTRPSLPNTQSPPNR